jgi:hypothetical protein
MSKRTAYLEFFNTTNEDKEKILNEKLVKEKVIDDDESFVIELTYTLEEEVYDLLEILEKYKEFIPSFYNYIKVDDYEKK